MIGIHTGTGCNGVMLLGEAWGEMEDKHGTPFKGRAGAQMARMMALGGWERDDFTITNCCSFRPQNNREPTDAEIEAWRPSWETLIAEKRPKVIVPLGNVPLRAVLGIEGILGKRGYLWWSEKLHCWVLPTVHPAFILRGNANWTAAWLRDVGMALQVAALGPPAAPKRELLLDPSPHVAGEWYETWKARGAPPISFDIETPDKGDDEEEADIALGQLQAPIYRIGFAWRAAPVTHGLSVPWGGAYLPVVQKMFEHAACSIVWNRHFDVPRLLAHGCRIGAHYDAQEMWHVLHTDLPKKLEFATSFLVPGQIYWKDQSWQRPAYYNAIDAAVTVEAFDVLYREGLGEEPLLPETAALPVIERTDEDIPF